MENRNSDDVENQMIRGQLSTHSTLSKICGRINDLEAFVFGINDALIEKGILSSKFLFSKIESVKKNMMDREETVDAGIAMRVDKEDAVFQPVNCMERLHICKGICCKLNFPLSQTEVEGGIVKWDLGKPYYIRHRADGYCCHLGAEGNCSIYANRPTVCKTYSCYGDERIWKDFDQMVLNEEWINDNLEGGLPS